MRVVGFWDMGTWWVGVYLPVCVCVCVCELPLSVGVCLSGSAYFSISCPSPTLTSPHGHSLSVSLCVSMVFVFGCLCLDVCICLPMYRSYRFHAKIRWQQTYHAVRAELKRNNQSSSSRFFPMRDVPGDGTHAKMFRAFRCCFQI